MYAVMDTLAPSFLILDGNEVNHKILDEFDFDIVNFPLIKPDEILSFIHILT